MDVIFEVVQSFMCVIEVYLMFDFYMAFFSLKGRFQNKYGRAVIVLLTAACVRMVNSLDSSMINIVAMQIIYLSLLFGLFYGNVLKKISCYLVGTAIMIGSELLWVILMAVPSDFSMEHIKNTKISVYMSLLGAKIIAFILFNIAKRRAKESYNKMEIKNFLLYSIVPLATLGIMVSLAYLDIDFDSIRFVQFLLILCSILSVIGDILNFYVFDRFSASIEKLRRQDVVITKMEMEERRYEQIEAVNQEHARFLHDIRHYMRAIGAMASENHDEEILDILSQLQVKISDAEIEMYCPNRLLNTILNEKKRETAEKGVMSDVATMRGEVTSTEADDDRVILHALLPVQTSMSYSTTLASLSGGRAGMSIRLSGYRECPLELGACADRRGVDPLDTAKYILAARSALEGGIFDY